jgi:hypothetical protein
VSRRLDLVSIIRFSWVQHIHVHVLPVTVLHMQPNDALKKLKRQGARILIVCVDFYIHEYSRSNEVFSLALE